VKICVALPVHTRYTANGVPRFALRMMAYVQSLSLTQRMTFKTVPECTQPGLQQFPPVITNRLCKVSVQVALNTLALILRRLSGLRHVPLSLKAKFSLCASVIKNGRTPQTQWPRLTPTDEQCCDDGHQTDGHGVYGSRGARRSITSNVAWPALRLGFEAALADAQLMREPVLAAWAVARTEAPSSTARSISCSSRQQRRHSMGVVRSAAVAVAAVADMACCGVCRPS
jgi:hypothetical protein